MSGASSRDQEPTVFTVAALNNINKPFLVNALAKSKANEEAVSESIIAIQKKLSNVVVELKKGLVENASIDILVSSINTGVLVLEGLDWSAPVRAVDAQVIPIDDKRDSKILKLDSNTPVYSNKPGERLDEWLFVLNNSFELLNISDDKQKLGLATTYVRGPVLQALIRFRKDDPNPNWKGFTKLLKDQYEPRNLEMKIRAQLRHARQIDGFQRYLSKFQELVNQLPNMSEDELYVAFLDGLADSYKHEVMRNPNCRTLNEAVRIASDYDFCMSSANASRKEINLNSMNRVNTSLGSRKPFDKNAQSNVVKRKFNKFQYVGSSSGVPNSSRNKAGFKPRYESKVTCYNCKKQGHYANTCTIKKVNVASIIGDNNVDSLLMVKGSVNGINLNLALDSGATACVLSHKIAKIHKFKILESNIKVKVADNEIVQVIGITEPVRIDVHGHTCILEMYVLEHDDHDALLGLSWFMATGAGIFPGEGILRFNDEIIRLEQYNSQDSEDSEYDMILMSELIDDVDVEDIEGDTDWFLLGTHEMKPIEVLDDVQGRKFANLVKYVRPHFANSFADLGACGINRFKINTTVEQTIFLPAYRKSMKEREEIKYEISKMLEAKVIRPSNSAWSAPIILIPKKDGTKRMCVDYRKLNSITVTENWPLPVIRDILDRLNGSNWFSTLDLKSGYWQIEMSPNSIAKTAFSTPDGHYEFLRVPFGLKNAPSHFSRIMHQTLGAFNFVEIYLDDMTIHSKTFEDHIMHVKKVIDALRASNLKINSEKCTWFAKTIKVLGHVVTNSTVSMDPSKVSAIKERDAPKTVKQVQQFLGICNYYRRFIKNFSGICSPLFQLLQKDHKWDWTDTHQKAFDEMKSCLIEYPILRHPDMSKPFLLHTDASGYAIGAILSQKDGDDEYVCAYESRILKGAELHYGITEKECLAVVFGIKKFRVYLHGQHFQVITDHSALNWLMSIADPQGRLARWAIILQAYDFKIIHKAGKAHTNVDALSRPVLPSILSTRFLKVPEAEISNKTLDPYEDEGLLYFLKHRKFLSGSSSKQIKRVEKLVDHFKMVGDNLLYKKNLSDTTFKKYPKLNERFELGLKAHLLGHFQLITTLERLQEDYYWKNMSADVAKVIAECLTCQRHQKVPALYHPARAIEVEGIFDQIGIDLVFGLPETKDGYIGVFCIMQKITKYPFVYPIKTKSMPEMVVCLLHYISVFGPPKQILSDQGNEFCNKLVAKLLNATGVEHKVTSAYNPRTNGMTERFNQTLIESLRKHAEENPFDWDKWIPYVLLAYRSRVHTSTKCTPFELVFGRKMNTFEDWTNTLLKDEEAALIQRANEIKHLVEHTQRSAKDNIKDSQVKQKIIQDNQNHLVLKILEPGTSVFIKNEGLLSKLSPRYSGPYKVVRHTSGGNYVLENALQELVKMSYPRQKLKVVSELENDDSVNLEVEKIIDHKKVNNQIVYLVKWKNSEDTDWLPVDNFNTMEVINKYHENLNIKLANDKNALKPRVQQKLLKEAREVNLRVQPNRTVRRVNKVDDLGPGSAVIPLKRGRGRPPKIMSINFLTLLIILGFFGLVCGRNNEPIIATALYCNEGEGNLLDMENSCNKDYKPKANTLLDPTYNDSKPYLVYDKMRHLVSGEATECKKEKTSIKTFRDFFRRDSLETRFEILPVTKEECEYMKRTNMCIDTEMLCENNICSTNKSPSETYSWLSEMTDEVINCILHKRFISADNENAVVFGNHNCVAKNGVCKLSRSTIVWDLNTIHRCPYYLVSSINAKKFPGEILLAKNNRLAFRITDKFKVNVCNDVEFLVSSEGLFISQDLIPMEKRFLGQSLAKHDMTDLTKFVLADEDLNRYEQSEIQNKLNFEICMGVVNTLNILKIVDKKYFKLKDYLKNDIILFSKHNALWVAKCYPIYEFVIEKISIFDTKCTEDVPVRFKVGKHIVSGFLDTNIIIKNSSRLVDCSTVEQMYFLNNSVIKRTEGEVFIVNNKSVYSHRTSLNMNSFNVSKNNFFHSKTITDGVDFASEFRSILMNDDLNFDDTHLTNTLFQKSEHGVSIFLNNANDWLGNFKHYIYGFLFIIIGIILISLCCTLGVHVKLKAWALTGYFILIHGALNFLGYFRMRCSKKNQTKPRSTIPVPIYKELIMLENKTDSKAKIAVEKSTNLATSILSNNYIA